MGFFIYLNEKRLNEYFKCLILLLIKKKLNNSFFPPQLSQVPNLCAKHNKLETSKSFKTLQ